MKKKPIVAVVYNCLMALATATLGAVVLSWPLLAVFVKIQKTNLIVKTTLATVMENYTQLLDYLLLPFMINFRCLIFRLLQAQRVIFMSVSYYLN